MLNLFKRKELQIDPLEAEIRERVAAERAKLEQEKRLYQVLVNDPLDFDSLVRIGKRIGADSLEIVNATGAIVRYFYKTKQVQTTTVEEEKATAEGYW
jgi:hypothetical protein